MKGLAVGRNLNHHFRRNADARFSLVGAQRSERVESNLARAKLPETSASAATAISHP